MNCEKLLDPKIYFNELSTLSIAIGFCLHSFLWVLAFLKFFHYYITFLH